MNSNHQSSVKFSCIQESLEFVRPQGLRETVRDRHGTKEMYCHHRIVLVHDETRNTIKSAIGLRSHAKLMEQWFPDIYKNEKQIQKIGFDLYGAFLGIKYIDENNALVVTDFSSTFRNTIPNWIAMGVSEQMNIALSDRLDAEHLQEIWKDVNWTHYGYDLNGRRELSETEHK